MRFTVHGTFDGEPAQVAWQDGELSGEPPVVLRLVRYEADNRPRVGQHGGPYTFRGGHLADPISAAILIRETLDPPLVHEGDKLGWWPPQQPGDPDF